MSKLVKADVFYDAMFDLAARMRDKKPGVPIHCCVGFTRVIGSSIADKGPLCIDVHFNGIGMEDGALYEEIEREFRSWGLRLFTGGKKGVIFTAKLPADFTLELEIKKD